MITDMFTSVENVVAILARWPNRAMGVKALNVIGRNLAYPLQFNTR